MVKNLSQLWVVLLLCGAATAQAAEPHSYWLGVGVEPAPASLRAQLLLPEDQGLLVKDVAPDSPALKAGITQHDVLLNIGGKPLAKPRDLVEAVTASEGKPVSIDLIRGGKPVKIEVVPAERPRDMAPPASEATAPDDWRVIERWIEGLREGRQPPVRFRFFRPGEILPEVPALKPLAADTSIVVSKQGDQPAQIVVRRGDEKWEVTEKELDRLPDDLRPHVQRMLGRPREVFLGDAASWEERVEKRLGEMSSRLDKLFEQLAPSEK